MTALGTPERPLRVAIVGSGPSGFYAAEAIYKHPITVNVDMFDRLPAPFGLVRYGVAPDHPRIKNVIKVYEKFIADHPDFSFFGNVSLGETISMDELKRFYDVIIIATGAQTDKKMGIKGEDLPGCYSSTDFVGWYNAHPDFQHLHFDFSQETAVVIGQGNVAMDLCRILLKTVDELKSTDISQKALDALAESNIKEVHCFGRRGPLQAAFTPVEMREFLALADCYTVIDPLEMILNQASQKELQDPANAARKKNFEILNDLVKIDRRGRKKKFVLHFYRSPVEVLGNGRVEQIVFKKNQLTGEPNRQKVEGTGEQEIFNCRTAFYSIGYQGVAINGLPFDVQSGVIPNDHGRVTDCAKVVPGVYVTGWIKRGAVGIIGSNKPDSEDTVQSVIQDLNHLIPCFEPSPKSLVAYLESKNVRVVTFKDWGKIDTVEIERGKNAGKPREKIASVGEMLSHL